MINKMKINLSEKIGAYLRYSQRGKEIEERFMVHFTPKWFTFLGWLSLLIALGYLFQETKSVFVGILIIVSYYLLYNFFTGSVSIFVKTRSLPIIISIIFTVLVFLFVRYLINSISQLVSLNAQ